MAGGPDEAPNGVAPAERSGRAALAAFVVAEVVALVIVVVVARDQWFFLDEWWFLTDRSLTSADDLLGAYNGHWSTQTVVAYRALYAVFGLRTYLPYLLLCVLTHLAVVALVRAVLRRVGIGPWASTGAASLLLLFGAGRQNIVFGVQFLQNGSIVLGLAQLLLADHDGPVGGRRDRIALVVGVLALSTSGVALPFVAGVGAAALVRRGWRAAALQTVPLAVVWLAWYATFGGEGSSVGGTVGAAARFWWDMARATALGFSQAAPVAVVVALVAVAGLAGAVARSRRTGDRARPAPLVGLVVAWVGFTAITAATRNQLTALVPTAATASRYVCLGAVLLLPCVVVGVDEARRRLAERAGERAGTLAVAVGAALLVVGVPGNVAALADREPVSKGDPVGLRSLAASRFLDRLPADELVSERSDLFAAWGPMTVGWLRGARDDGELDVPDDLPAGARLLADLRLATDLTARAPDEGGARRDEGGCEPDGSTAPTTVDVGDRVVVGAPTLVRAVDGDARSGPLRVRPADGPGLDVVAGPITIVLSDPDGGPADACVARG